MRRISVLLLCLVGSSCAVRSAAVGAAAPLTPSPVEILNPAVPAIAGSSLERISDTTVSVAQVASTEPLLEGGDSLQVSMQDSEDEDATADDDDDDDGTPSADEGESHDVSGTCDATLRYSADLSDEQLQALWKNKPEELGSISLGFVDEGRLINGIQFPKGEQWIVVSPEKTYATKETIDFVITAIAKVREQFPVSPPLRVNQISAPEGGFVRPHKSHQNGRDVDLAFYYPGVDPIRVREREKYIDVPRNWALLKSIITYTDVQMVLVDRRVQKVLFDYALSVGEDRAWLDSVFHNGHASIVQHARHHRDHFHVRFFNGRAQELGRRVAPLLAQRPEQNIVMHRVHRGDTLGAIANHYNSTIEMVRKANHMTGSFLRLAQVLKVPLRGPCTHCPVPPPVVVPERRIPPPAHEQVQQASTTASR